MDDEMAMQILDTMVWNDNDDEDLQPPTADENESEDESCLDEEGLAARIENVIFRNLNLKDALETLSPSSNVTATSRDASISLGKSHRTCVFRQPYAV